MPLGFRNVCQNMRAMEVYLEENCADLDFTAIKLCFGKGQNETGILFYFSVFFFVVVFFFCPGDMPFFVKAGVSLGWKNLVQNMRAMEVYLEENCADLDFTAVKLLFGKGQNETGLISFSRVAVLCRFLFHFMAI